MALEERELNIELEVAPVLQDIAEMEVTAEHTQEVLRVTGPQPEQVEVVEVARPRPEEEVSEGTELDLVEQPGRIHLLEEAVDLEVITAAAATVLEGFAVAEVLATSILIMAHMVAMELLGLFFQVTSTLILREVLTKLYMNSLHSINNLN